MRNRYPGDCYRCGEWVKAGEGHFELMPRRGWRVQPAPRAIQTDRTPPMTAERSRLEALAARWPNDNGDPPDTEYQRGYMAACRDCADELAAELAGAEEETLGAIMRMNLRLEAEAARLRAALGRITDSEADTSDIGGRRWTAAMHQECVAIARAALLNAPPPLVNAPPPLVNAVGNHPKIPDSSPPAPPPIDPAVVAELERLAAVATPAPWDAEGGAGEIMAWLEPDEHRPIGKIWSSDWWYDVPLILLLRNNLPAILAALRQGTAQATVTDAMVEAAGTAFAHYCGGYDSSMRAAILAALQAQRGE